MIASKHGDLVIKLETHGGSLSRAIAHAESVLDAQRDRALAALVDEANRHGAEPACRRPTMGFPPACIPACLYLLLVTESFEEALTEVVNLGGDTDTAGAILGAMAGAYYGVDAIPQRWLDGLQNREGIEARAIALAQRSLTGLHIPDLIATEHLLSRKEGESFEQFVAVGREGGGRDANPVL
jgi:ADP-ribosyl-[dinitrogen reductase] hydrolase